MRLSALRGMYNFLSITWKKNREGFNEKQTHEERWNQARHRVYILLFDYLSCRYATIIKMESLPREQKLLLCHELHRSGYDVAAYLRSVQRFRAERYYSILM